MRTSLLTLLFLILTVLLPQDSVAGRVHDFYCINCHPFNNMEPATGLADTLCLLCHSAGNNVPIQRLSNPTQSTDPPGGLFETGDASNLLGSYPAELTPGGQTSHIWSSGDIKPEAGALPPQQSAMNLSFFGVSKDKVVCSRCHDVHAFKENNPQLLRAGAGTADAMCLDCHRVWDVQNNHGKETHPMVPDYAAVLAANPDKFRALPDNFGSTGGINLLDGNCVSCTSCHGVHWVDSDASTLDGKANAENLSTGDGRLLLHDGPDREDPDRSLCQTCHNYARHGGGSPSIGCMVCHGSHEYDPLNNPNYYMLKKEVTLNRPLLDESQPAEEITVNFDYTMAPAAGNYDGYDGICLQCHVDNLSAGHDASRADCSRCHSHEYGFAHGGGGTDCIECHGHDSGYEYDTGLYSQGKGTFFSHSTHTEDDDSDDLKGPALGCDTCHDVNNFPYFKDDVASGVPLSVDANGDGKLDLSETNVCDRCHSRDGAVDGVDDPVVGAKQLWNSGAYGDSGTLQAGKEKWCISCHDAGRSTLGGQQAPDVSGNSTDYGYYASGHGAFEVSCEGCHDSSMRHIFYADAAGTYSAALDNYKVAYRLPDIDGNDPIDIPYTDNCATYSTSKFALCFSCHNEQALLQGGSSLNGCNSPYPSAEVITRFSDYSGANPQNLHWYHLVFSNWDSDSDGTDDSKIACMTCHNPHGAPKTDGISAAYRMTVSEMNWTPGTDVDGDYVEGTLSTVSPCSWCHLDATRYYRDELPVLRGIALADNNSADPVEAEEGYTNSLSVTVNINSGSNPAGLLMQFAEDAGFSVNVSGWIPYGSSYSYELTGEDGEKIVYAKLKNDYGETPVKSATIILDRVAPTVSGSALTAPNGGETWYQDTDKTITWASDRISDDNLKGQPISLAYSLDSGSSFANLLTTYDDDDGSYTWTIPVLESTTARVQLTVTDKAGNQSSDQSDSNFEIAAYLPIFTAFSAADNDSSDPAPAEAGYTNSQSIALSLETARHPTHMKFTENVLDVAWTNDSDPSTWIAYSDNYAYDLSAGEGAKTVYAKIKNGAGVVTSSAVIVLDMTDPEILASTLVAPNGHTSGWEAEFWTKGSSQTATWAADDISDNIGLKDNPIFIRYSADSGATWPVTIAGNEASNIGVGNNGSYLWSVDGEISYSARIQLVARDKAGNEATDDSDHDFNVSPLPEYIVTNTNTSGGGSLRQALADLQANGGNSPLWFNIPGTDLTNGVAVINSSSEMPWLLAGSVVDGGSQTVLRGDTNINGPEVRIHYVGASNINGLGISTGPVTIKDIQFTNFLRGVSSTGENASIEGCQFGFSSDATGFNASPNSYDIWAEGKTNIGSGNYFACSTVGVRITGNTDSSVADNVFGIFPNGNECKVGTGIYLGGVDNPQILNNIINSTTSGVSIGGYNDSSDGIVIQGNQIGAVYSEGAWTDFAGPDYGIRIESKSGGNHLIGGGIVASSDDALNQSNVIGADNIGIDIVDVLDNSMAIHGNYIGTNPEQDEVFPGSNGILINYVYLYGLQGVTVGGGGAAQAGNVIANMSEYGIRLEGDGSGLKNHIFSRNSFYDNGDDAGDDAIYLGANGNNAIARPVIAELTSTTVKVNDLYGGYSATTGDVVEVYYADFAGTEYGEGKEFIASAQASQGSTSVTVDISGANSGSGINYGDWITVTNTNVFNGTSAFSANVRLAGSTVPTLDWTGESNYAADGVDPDTGTQLTNFEFRVKYTDADNDSPWPIEVRIDLDDNGTYGAGEVFAMTEVDAGDTNYADGKLYSYSRSLSLAGDNTLKYSFYASDGRSDATGTPTSDHTLTVTNTSPQAPTVVSPADGAVDVTQPLVLESSAFFDADGDTHYASQWQVSTASGGDFEANLIEDSGAVSAATQYVVNYTLSIGTTYYWRVRYQDNNGAWSAYTEASLTTLNNSPPDTPTHITPAANAEDLSTDITLVASAFSDSDGDTHQGSVWQVSTQSGDNFVAGIVHNSGIVAASTSYVIPVSLQPNTVYFWRARYQDSAGQWSNLSEDTRFKTTSIESYFNFDEGSGTTVADSVGNNNGWFQNDPVWIAGFNGGQALRFDGVNDGISWNYNNGRPSNNFAVEAMVKATTTHQISDAESTAGTGGISGQNYLFDASYFNDPSAGAGISLGTNGVSVYEHSGGYMPALARYVPAEKNPVEPDLGTEWNHVIVSYVDRQPHIYLNGKLVHVGLQSPKTTVYAPIVVANGGYGKFAGDIDDVVIHKTSLTEAEVLDRCIAVGKCTDADLDSDGVSDSTDNCPFEYNPAQDDLDNDGIGNLCEYVSYWKMDDGSGSIAADEAENSDVALNGGTTWSTGVNGSGGLLFDSVNVDAAAENILDNHSGDFSISIWLKFPAGAVNPKWSLGKGTDPYRSIGVGIGHWVTTDTDVAPSFFVNDGTPGAFLDPEYEWPHRLALSASAIPRDTWGHFVWTVDRTNQVMKVYKNGVYEGQRDISILGTNPVTDDKLFRLGSAGEASSKYTGSMDNLAVYDFVLTSDDVQARCEADAGVGNCP